MLQNEKKTIIGHNFIFDLCFIYSQFVDELPTHYTGFANKWQSMFPQTYDTKVLAQSLNFFGKTELGHLHYKCTNDKKLCNNLAFKLDDSKTK